jgi:ceramide glucosyltransferase
MVTCLYRRGRRVVASRFEALGIATEFAPQRAGGAPARAVAEFAAGSTMVFRARAIGKNRLASLQIANYLADDYQLGRHIAQLGYRIEFAPMVVETHLGRGSWGRPGGISCAGPYHPWCRGPRDITVTW